MPMRDLRSHHKRGQALVLGLITIAALVVGIFTIIDVGNAVMHKIRLQDAADASAYSSAVWEARFMNFAAYTNRAMVAHLVTVSEFTSMISFLHALSAWLKSTGPGAAMGVKIQVRVIPKATKIATLMISYAQTMNELIARSQTELFEITKVLVPVEAQNSAYLNDMKADLNVSLRRGGKFHKNMIMEMIYGFAGNSAQPKFQRWINRDFDKYNPTIYDNSHGYSTYGSGRSGMVAGAVRRGRDIPMVNFNLDHLYTTQGSQNIPQIVCSMFGWWPMCKCWRWEWQHNQIAWNDLRAWDRVEKKSKCKFSCCWDDVWNRSYSARHDLSKNKGKVLRQFKGVPDFVQLTRDMTGANFNSMLPNVFVVLQKSWATVANLPGHPRADQIYQNMQRGLEKNTGKSPMLNVYRPLNYADPRYPTGMVAFSRARVVYRGDKHVGGAMSTPSLFNPFWNVQLYPFHGEDRDGTNDNDRPRSYTRSGDMQNYIIDETMPNNYQNLLNKKDRSERVITH
jgi:hypothetical protein